MTHANFSINNEVSKLMSGIKMSIEEWKLLQSKFDLLNTAQLKDLMNINCSEVKFLAKTSLLKRNAIKI